MYIYIYIYMREREIDRYIHTRTHARTLKELAKMRAQLEGDSRAAGSHDTINNSNKKITKIIMIIIIINVLAIFKNTIGRLS